jgi:hypothetical protein
MHSSHHSLVSTLASSVLARTLGPAAALAVLAIPALAQTPTGLRNTFRIVTSIGIPNELHVDTGWLTSGPLVTPGSTSSSNAAGCASQGDCTATSDFGHLDCAGSGVANNCTSNGVFLILDDEAGQPRAQFNDVMLVVSNTLPAGTPVQVRFALALDGHLTAQGPPYSISYGARLDSGRGQILVQNDSPGSLSSTFTAIVGYQYPIHGSLSASVGISSLGGLAPPVLSGSYSVDLEAHMWFDSLDAGAQLQFTSGHDYAQPPLAYCASGTSSNGCVASIAASANPSVSLATACNIGVASVDGQRSGLLFYGVDNTGFTPAPWGAGSASTLCVKSPTQRTPIQNSGGAGGACDGSVALDWNAYQSAHPLAVGNPWSVGDKVYVQAWFRDPLAVKSTNLSNAIELTYLP